MASLTDFDALTFDCYGTLIDWERGILDSLRPWVNAHHRKDLTDDAILEGFGAAETALEAEFPRTPYPVILAKVHARLAENWNIQPDAVDAARFGESVGDWPAFPDSASALQYLARYFKLIILSNVDRASFAKSNLQLAVTFDRVLTAQDIGSYKPDASNFAYALSDVETTLGIGKKRVLHVAQSIFHDIIPAKAAGLTTAWINRRKASGGWGATPAPAATGEAARPDFEVTSMAGLVALHQAHLRA